MTHAIAIGTNRDLVTVDVHCIRCGKDLIIVTGKESDNNYKYLTEDYICAKCDEKEPSI